MKTGPSGNLLLPVEGDVKTKKWHQSTAAWLDAVVFWACSARCVICSMLDVDKYILKPFVQHQNHVVFLLPAA
jgi:hypothetical protein